MNKFLRIVGEVIVCAIPVIILVVTFTILPYETWSVECKDFNGNIAFKSENNSYIVVSPDSVHTNGQEFAFPANTLSCHKQKITHTRD